MLGSAMFSGAATAFASTDTQKAVLLARGLGSFLLALASIVSQVSGVHHLQWEASRVNVALSMLSLLSELKLELILFISIQAVSLSHILCLGWSERAFGLQTHSSVT